MKKLFYALSIFGILSSGCNKNNGTPTAPATKTYTLTLTIQGQGQCEVTPNKNAYDDDENVTLKATGNPGWKFKDWEGSILTTDNPFLLKMDGNKTIVALFMQSYEPDISGKWDGTQYSIDLELNQPSLFDSNFTGKANLVSSGNTFEYFVTGYNAPNKIKMVWSRSGYYQINYTGVWQDNSTIDGKMEQDSVENELDFVRILGKMQMDKRKEIKGLNRIE